VTPAPQWKQCISYRATQSMFVRQVADQLISAGCDLWFAEYVTFDWQLRQNDAWLQSRIAEGTEQCEWGVVFASEDYLASDHCRFELDRLSARLGPQRLLQVSLDGTRLERLHQSETIQCSADEVMEAVDFIARRTGMGMAAAARPGRTLTCLSHGIRFGRRFTLDSYGWRRWWGGKLDALVNPQLAPAHWQGAVKWGPFLQRDVQRMGGSSAKILMNLRYGKEQPAHYDNWGLDFQQIENARQERDVLNKLNEYASTVHRPNLERLGARVKICGVHVLLKDNAFGHIALTYRVTTDEGSFWTRKISVHLRDPASTSPCSFYEFVFTFSFSGSFQEYCRHSGIMDGLALSTGMT